MMNIQYPMSSPEAQALLNAPRLWHNDGAKYLMNSYRVVRDGDDAVLSVEWIKRPLWTRLVGRLRSR